MDYEKQYLDLARDILEYGTNIKNERTGKVCITIPSTIFKYDCSSATPPLLTTRRTPWKLAVGEILGYLKGHTDAQDFSDLGSPSWFANANKNKSWLTNPYRKGMNDMGKVYGAVARDFGGINLIEKVYNNLKRGIDDRGEIITFWKPDEFDKGCLRPCMFQHHFTLIGKDLYLTSYQRSCDVPLGLVANQFQVYFLLRLMAQITGNNPKEATHIIINPHVYEDQIEPLKEQLKRTPMPNNSSFVIDDYLIQSLMAVEEVMTPNHCKITGYEYNKNKINFPFSE